LTTLEIHGTGTHNRGAELMAIAIAERMRVTFPGIRITVPPGFGTHEARARHGFLTTREYRFRSRTLARLMIATILHPAQTVHPARVHAVLDASGFAFTDQSGPRAVRHLVTRMNRRRRQRQPLICMPQAFGPFRNTEVAQWTRRLIHRSSLVCARDNQSLAELRTLADAPVLRRFPDFTAGVAAVPCAAIRLPEPFVAVVPNQRMVDKGTSAQAYYAFLRHAVTTLRARALNPVFILHDQTKDRQVLTRLGADGHDLPVLEHSDPRVLKWMLGRAQIVIGSRFHALVGALSQGVPCIGAGWSHKYPELFAEFDCAELLVPDLAQPAAFDAALDRVRTAEARENWSTRIAVAAQRVKQQNELMWREIEALLNAAVEPLNR
jgi:polysaccharide pyruvyl transferase WcaK-like protein